MNQDSIPFTRSTFSLSLNLAGIDCKPLFQVSQDWFCRVRTPDARPKLASKLSINRSGGNVRTFVASATKVRLARFAGSKRDSSQGTLSLAKKKATRSFLLAAWLKNQS